MLVKKLSIMLVLALMLMACDRSDDGPIFGTPQAPGPDDTLYVDDTVFTRFGLMAIAFGDPQMPEGFYEDDSPVYRVRYETTAGIDTVKQYGPHATELSAVDIVQARAWSDAVASNWNMYGETVSERETEKFFEFTRPRIGGSFNELSRVHKCSYVDLSGYKPYLDPYYWHNTDTIVYSGTIGTFNHQPLTAETTKELAEYHYVHSAIYHGHSIIGSATVDHDSTFEHTIYSLGLSYGDWSMWDKITLTRRLYRVDRETGALTYERRVLWVVKGYYHPNPVY